jgi:hypothetical protein
MSASQVFSVRGVGQLGKLFRRTGPRLFAEVTKPVLTVGRR